MSMLEIGMLAGVGLNVLAIYLVYRQPVVTRRAGGLGYEEQERRYQPEEIANGTLVMSEQYLRCDLPRGMGARVDQVYLTPAGDLVPVDTKTGYRNVVRREDLVELSVQPAVLRHTTAGARPAGRVATWGYVRKVAPGRNPTYLRTPLLTDRELVELYDRYWAVEAGAAPQTTRDSSNCRHCPVVTRCPAAPADHPNGAARTRR